MPTFEYECAICGIIFEELLISGDEVREYSKHHPCPNDKAHVCPRVMSVTNFNFKGMAYGDPRNRNPQTTKGSTGVHDLDYPTLDKAIGRSATRKWKDFTERKKARDAARKEFGTSAISVAPDGTMRPLPKGHEEVRANAFRVAKDIHKEAVERKKGSKP